MKEHYFEEELFEAVEEQQLKQALEDEKLRERLDKEAQLGAIGLLIGVVALPVIALAGAAASLIGKKKR